jgi:hypothetical protein
MTGQLPRRRPSLAIPVVLAALIVGFVAFVLRQATSEGQEELLRSLAQVGAQFLLVGLVGFFIKEYLDDRREQQRRADAEQDAERRRQDALDAFRLDVLRHIVGTANQVRRAGVILDAEGSAEAYAEQMRLLADAYLDLRVVTHEVAGAADAPNPVFPDWPAISLHQYKMRDYLQACVREFREENARLQRLRADQPAESADEVWARISSLPRVRELLVEDPRPRGGPPTPLWSEFFSHYEQAMPMIRRAILRGEMGDVGRPGGSADPSTEDRPPDAAPGSELPRSCAGDRKPTS